MAHTLRGTAATLGADRLAALAGRLETGLQVQPDASIDDDDIRSAMDAIHLELSTLASALPHSTALVPADAMPLDLDALRAVLNELEALLAQNDTAAIAFFEEHESSLRPALGLSCDELARQVRRFDFETARETLQNQRGGRASW